MKHIDGHEVVKVEQAFSPLHTEEVPKPFRNVAKLTLVTGDVFYGCREQGCEFVSTAPQGVNAHFAAHHRGVNSKRWGEIGEWTVQELFDTVLDYDTEMARVHRLLAAARERAVEYRNEATSLRNKLNRRENEISQLQQRLVGLQIQWQDANEKARRTQKVTPPSEVARLERMLEGLAAQVESLSNGRLDTEPDAR